MMNVHIIYIALAAVDLASVAVSSVSLSFLVSFRSSQRH